MKRRIASIRTVMGPSTYPVRRAERGRRRGFVTTNYGRAPRGLTAPARSLSRGGRDERRGGHQLNRALTQFRDHTVAQYWKEQYDLRAVMERDWKTLAPKLDG